MKRLFFCLLIVSFIISCNPTDEELPFNTDNKYVNISPEKELGNFTSLWFFDDKEGVITTDEGYLATTNDGGETWTDSKPFEEVVSIENLYYSNKNFGFCTGGDTNTLLYNDLKWNTYNFPIKGTKPSSFQILNENYIYASTYRGKNNSGYLLRSIDSGSTWDTMFIKMADITQVLMLNDQVGFVLIDGDNKIGLQKTNDGGKNWFSRIPTAYSTLFNSTIRLTKLVAVDNDHLLLIARGNKANEGMLFVSEDGGENWKSEFLNYALNDIYATPKFVYFVGDDFFAAQWPVNLSSFSNAYSIIKNWNQYDPKIDFLLNNKGYTFAQYHDIKQIKFVDDDTGFILTNNKNLVFKINITTKN